jgi:hypothetical protein
MAEAADFAEKAREIEALAALTENPLLKVTLRMLAKDYRDLSKQEDNAALSKALQVQDRPELDQALQEIRALR